MSEDMERHENESPSTPDAEQSLGSKEEVVESNAAKRLRMLGISNEPEPPAIPVKKVGFFENFWYHYKGVTIAVLFLAAVIGIGVNQMLNKTVPDIYIMYAGPHYYENTSGIMGAFKATMPKDYNGDGEKIVNILQTVNYTEEQLEMLKEEANKQAEAAGEDAHFDANINKGFYAQEYEKFTNEILIGESVICILDPSLYEEICGDDLLLTLEEALGYTPKSAYDDYAIKFKELNFAKKYKVFDALPDDSLLCIRRVTAMSSLKGKKAKERHEDHVDYFKAMVEYTRPYKDTAED